MSILSIKRRSFSTCETAYVVVAETHKSGTFNLSGTLVIIISTGVISAGYLVWFATVLHFATLPLTGFARVIRTHHYIINRTGSISLHLVCVLIVVYMCTSCVVYDFIVCLRLVTESTARLTIEYAQFVVAHFVVDRTDSLARTVVPIHSAASVTTSILIANLIIYTLQFIT